MKVWFWTFLSLALLSLAACGGGGSSGSSGSTGTMGSVPSQAPSVPQPSYSGNTRAVVVGESNAVGITLDFFWGSYLIQNFGSSAINFASSFNGQTINKTQRGPVSGYATIIGRPETDGSAWYEITYSNYVSVDPQTYADETANGIVIVYTNPESSGVSSYTIGFDGYSYSEGSSIVITQGYVTTVQGSNPTYQANLMITNGQNGDIAYLSNFTEVDGSSGVSYSGRLYDSVAGYFQTATVAPMPTGCLFPDPQEPTMCYPESDSYSTVGDVTMSGATATVLHVGVMSNFYLFLGLDLDGNGSIDEGTRFNEITGSIDNGSENGFTNSKPVAHIIQANTAQVGGVLDLDGSFSYVPNGWLTYSWQLLQTPPGSSVAVQNALSPQLTFTPDVAGHYLLGLTVTSTSSTIMKSTDLLQVVVENPDDNNPLSGRSAFTLPASTSAEVGETTGLDGAASPGLINVTNDQTLWTLLVPPGSHTFLNNAMSLFPSLIPDVPGYYEAAYINPNSPSSETILNRMVIAAGADIYFSPAIAFNSVVQGSYGLALGDFDTSGRFGIAMVGLPPDISPVSTLWLWQRTTASAAAFNSPALLSTNQPWSGINNQGLGILDFNNDGQSDIAVAVGYGASVYLSQPGGSYLEDNLTLPDGGTNGGLAVGVLNAISPQTSSAVVMMDYDSANSALATFFWNGSAFGAPVVDSGVIPPSPASPGGTPKFALGDVTGDGKADAVFCVLQSSSAQAQLAVEPGNGAGNFGAPTYYTLPGKSCDTLKLADLTGNGREDVIVTDGDYLDIFMQTAGGTLQAETPIVMFSPASGLAIGDFNGDGFNDIVVLQCSDGACSNSAAFTEDIGIYWGSASGPSGKEYLEDAVDNDNDDTNGQITVGDLNGDGILDIVIELYGTIYVMYGEHVD